MLLIVRFHPPVRRSTSLGKGIGFISAEVLSTKTENAVTIFMSTVVDGAVLIVEFVVAALCLVVSPPVVGIGYLSLSNAALRHIRLDRFASSANGSPLTSVRGSIPYRSTIH